MKKWQKIVWILASYILLVALGYLTERSNFFQLFALFAALFAGYWWISKHKNAFNLKQIIIVGLLFRVSLLLMTPNLSDDFWRFIWDGRLLSAGNNPYLYLPEVSRDLPEVKALSLDGTVYENLNSKTYYTVYPPLNQAVFGIAAALGQQNIASEIFVLRMLVILAELATMLLLSKILTARRKPLNRHVVCIQPVSHC
ncbi:MAG: hypothetical protein HKN32_08970 [Flavobacteriales bacterium]|nr:hypothetical protein [Flavobacteriales bacterium]